MKNFFWIKAALAVGITLSPWPCFGDMSATDQQALEQTQHMLKDSSQRQKAIQSGGTGAAQADAMVKNAVGGDPKKAEEVYALSADLMKVLVEKSNGDPAKMQQMMLEFQKNPEAFLSLWSPEQRARLKKIADEVEKPRAPAHGH